ncbi:amino acid/amide ABC transporter membrane protein 2 (HAAT family) /amino acid/amide ABC transporter ATP-binding protein 1 (HAAT family) [Saccharothrix carnea]|uniref:Amino acid/amide ABC transporter membrane protein 2 (HAAT family) /amino acid/amide ABC transporter ATP-binding protein 1 (HAAT family) n=1 Tax=Saccharothrix carnea TaxID=1280637 RepID=A0A2P8IG60_SACCR|nr:ATP-binding cassette domain-containing protein [Saccharothrix carnea]PSL57447.1 amino acid/amide ABC transporter membrane protein 2 (HAAT family) /amino acid/amide ABC transporter ATP-binding protein 1 (HAAT family) [Saccharothrix carnea]
MGTAVRNPLVLGLVAAAAVAFGVAGFASSYVTFLLTGAAVTTVFMQSYGLITGRAGVISLCQLSFAAIGAWVVGWANVADVPGGFYAWLPLGGLAAVVAGLVIGLPALRLRGVNLAVATFAFATALDVVFTGIAFPGQDTFDFVRRPAGFTDDSGYFVFTVAVVTAIFVGLWLLDRSRAGGALVEIRHSERAAAAHGISVARGKLTAFALSAFVAGVGGGLMAGQLGVVAAGNFATFASVSFFAIALFVGTNNIEGAIAGGLIGAVFPVIIDALGIPQDLSALFFGIGAIQVLRLGGSQTDLLRASRRRKRQSRAHPPTRESPTPTTRESNVQRTRIQRSGGGAALEVRGLRVRFGALTAVDGVDLVVPKGHVVGLVGPNGAGKSTLINAVTGFTTRYDGTVLLDGRPVDGLAAHHRARAGLRRSFQQLRVPTALSVGMFLQVAAGRKLSRDEVDEQLALFECPTADTPMDVVDVATRRLLEVAGLAAGRPPVLLLDEPAAGHSSTETRLLQRRLAELPERFGTAVLLVEHDIELVRSTCDSLVVVDFGRVIASGPPDEVLADPAVVAAYLGAPAHSPEGNS